MWKVRMLSRKRGKLLTDGAAIFIATTPIQPDGPPDLWY